MKQNTEKVNLNYKKIYEGGKNSLFQKVEIRKMYLGGRMDCCDHQYSTSLLLFIDAIVNDCLHEFALLNSRFISFSAIDYIINSIFYKHR